MNEKDRQAYQARYNEWLAEYGHDPRALGWTKGKQAERFAALTRNVDIASLESILDVGCGFGDLYGFLRDNGFNGQYLGVDFVPELIQVGREAYPNADFETCDIAELARTRTFELVVASGIFNGLLEHEDQWAHIERTLRTMHQLSSVACAADFMSSYVDYQADGTFYAEPERMLTIAKSMSRRVSLLHDYLPFEFAVWVFSDDNVVEGARFAPAS